MIDSHCHFAAPDFDQDLDAVISRATDAGVAKIVTISDEMKDIDPSRSIAEKYEHIFYTIGVHPHHASSFDLIKHIERLRSEAKHPKCRAIGEIGLDYHYMRSPKDTQQRIFEQQLLLAKELGLPAVVHCREAVGDLRTIVQHVKPPRIVIHCCTEAWDDVAWFVDQGHFLSFTGIVTYSKSDSIRDTLKRCPSDRFMLETDAPFLAPVPHRGKRCEPMHVMETAKEAARVRGVSLEEIDRTTSANAVEFFGLAS
jgi:TatD DNase family protein